MPSRIQVRTPPRSTPREHRHKISVEELANTSATGVQLNDLTDGGETTLHKHVVTEDLLPGLVTDVTGDLTLTDAHYILAVDASLGDITITLPLAATYTKKTYYIKKMDSSTHSVIVKVQGNDVIDGEIKFIINDQYNAMEIHANGGTRWLNL